MAIGLLITVLGTKPVVTQSDIFSSVFIFSLQIGVLTV